MPSCRAITRRTNKKQRRTSPESSPSDSAGAPTRSAWSAIRAWSTPGFAKTSFSGKFCAGGMRITKGLAGSESPGTGRMKSFGNCWRTASSTSRTATGYGMSSRHGSSRNTGPSSRNRAGSCRNSNSSVCGTLGAYGLPIEELQTLIPLATLPDRRLSPIVT